jgi:hypothetical protein
MNGLIATDCLQLKTLSREFFLPYLNNNVLPLLRARWQTDSILVKIEGLDV